MIEKNFDIPFIAGLALREKQIQQNYRPIIAVHKWFARRPGTLFRGLLLAELQTKPIQEVYYQSHDFRGIKIADPFMGGGTPLIEANRLGCDIEGFDINPMAYWVVKQEIERLELKEYLKAAQDLRAALEKDIGHLYRTRCEQCGNGEASVKYFLWVKTIDCRKCAKPIDLFPGHLVAQDTRHPKNVFVCHKCGRLTEATDRKKPGPCRRCGTPISPEGRAKRGQCPCPSCGVSNTFPDKALGPPRHRLFALEYHCFACAPAQSGRFFKAPDDADLQNTREAEERLGTSRLKYVPEDEIPSGDETNRLLRWGYSHYREMFNARQLLGLELSARLIARVAGDRVRNALATNLSDLLRYQNMLCRYDAMALKSLDIFSVHGFPVGLIQCESNILGVANPRSSICIGSGGWANIIEKFRKAKLYCDEPFEIRHRGAKKEIVPIKGERIGDNLNGAGPEGGRVVSLHCGDAAISNLTPNSLDGVFTDPPYFGNVQYAELMDFCYVWLRRLLRGSVPEFVPPSTRNAEELTGNEDMGRGLDHFTQGISAVFRKMAAALKPGAPLAFTYHHNNLEAYYPIAVAILDAGLTCSASLPCPAEMSASIHISGTGSSIIDTVFVCRSTGTVSRKWMAGSIEDVAALVNEDAAQLREGGVIPTMGDLRCVTHGHLVRLAIWNLRRGWDANLEPGKRLLRVSVWMRNFGRWEDVEPRLHGTPEPFQSLPLFAVGETRTKYGRREREISF